MTDDRHRENEDVGLGVGIERVEPACVDARRDSLLYVAGWFTRSRRCVTALELLVDGRRHTQPSIYSRWRARLRVREPT